MEDELGKLSELCGGTIERLKRCQITLQFLVQMEAKVEKGDRLHGVKPVAAY